MMNITVHKYSGINAVRHSKIFLSGVSQEGLPAKKHFNLTRYSVGEKR